MLGMRNSLADLSDHTEKDPSQIEMDLRHLNFTRKAEQLSAVAYLY